MPSSPAIETQRLSRSFAATRAVADVTFAVDSGEMFGLVGPDGAGKSTLIRLLCGLIKPSGGAARLLGLDLETEGNRLKSRIGYLSQNFTLYGDLSIDENIEFFADIHGVQGWRKRRDELLDFTRLSPFRGRLAAALSGGMKKKLALACALIHRPAILFLDEPSTGVDPVSRGEFWSILSGILSEGITIVMTTPYLDEAERCHRVGLMNEGAMIRTGVPDEIRNSMGGAMFTLSADDLAGVCRILRMRWPSSAVVRYGDRLHFHARNGRRDRDEASAWLAHNGLPSVRFAEIEPSLEDVFVSMMRPSTEEEHPHVKP